MANLNFRDNWQRQKILKSKKHQYKALEEINELVVEKRCGKKVTLVDGTQLTEFISCAYLGLDQDERVVKAATDNIFNCGVNFAVARTRMKVKSFDVLDNLLNQIFCNGYSTVFTSLHLAHLGFLPILGSGEMPSFTMTDKGPLFILDNTVHASVQINRGIISQFGDIVFVDFQKIDQLRDQFKMATDHGFTPVALADGIGSMGGACPVKELFYLLEDYNGYTYLDDAHGTSVYGTHGCGYVLDELGNQFHPRLALAASLSKGFGANGGVIVLPTKEDEQMVKRFACAYLFSNPSPLAIVDSAIASAKIHLSDEIYQLRDRLRNNIIYFDSLMTGEISNRIINYKTTSPVRCVKIGDEFKAIAFSSELKKRGLLLSAAMYPTVAKEHSILRVTISADHRQEDIRLLCENIKEITSDMMAVTA
jgi:7-keto-8-aminopelargonate synthetase-like enzyme